jgi:hypothetical protein
MTAPIHRTIMYSDSVHIPINAITIPTITLVPNHARNAIK